MRWFKKKPKSCETCEFYSVYTTKDSLRADKSISPGEIVMTACSLGNMELTDITPCEKWKRAPADNHNWSTAFFLYMKKEFGEPPKKGDKHEGQAHEGQRL